jgi:hypothetical protein
LATFDAHSPVSAVLEAPESRAILEEVAPDLLDSPMVNQLAALPLRGLLRLVLGDEDPRVPTIVDRVSLVEDPRPVEAEESPIAPDSAYEPEPVERGSALVDVPREAERYLPVEVTAYGPSHGNPFVDVEFGAEFRSGDQTAAVGGFYDGDGRYVIRFLPPTAGSWEFTTRSTARSLDGVKGQFEVAENECKGPVGVVDDYHFAHADGTPFIPLGTTSYAWTHQDDELQERTLAALASAPFNKLRMCLFPKDYLYNVNDPERYVWPRKADGTWDTTRFDVEYWRRLERRIRDLGELGIEADLIVFHPYDDRWGLSHQSRAADDRYVRYMARRLGAFPNVWWSMANEYDLLLHKRPSDWDRLANLIRSEDHVGHPISIHNGFDLWDYSSDWATHCSIQHGEQLAKRVDQWRRQWGKPVLVDEAGYEGDLDQGWGNLTGEEMVRRFWEVSLRGGYATHGETFYREDDVIWWSKGGDLRGESLARLDFLKQLIAEAPTSRLDPLPSDFDAIWGGAADRYCLIYFGDHRPRFRDVVIPPGMAAEIDVIDTWNMTIEPQPGVHSGTVRVQLPARPYTAIRLRGA